MGSYRRGIKDGSALRVNLGINEGAYDSIQEGSPLDAILGIAEGPEDGIKDGC